jgi:hypothetical protein
MDRSHSWATVSQLLNWYSVVGGFPRRVNRCLIFGKGPCNCFSITFFVITETGHLPSLVSFHGGRRGTATTVNKLGFSLDPTVGEPGCTLWPMCGSYCWILNFMFKRIKRPCVLFEGLGSLWPDSSSSFSGLPIRFPPEAATSVLRLLTPRFSTCVGVRIRLHEYYVQGKLAFSRDDCAASIWKKLNTLSAWF